MKALILINLQNDFLTGGALAVPQAEAVIALANQLQGSFKLVLASQQWHPGNHRRFAAQHPLRSPGEIIQIKKVRQLLWPVHCVQSTRGAELAAGLVLTRLNKAFRNGTDPEVDGYSAFFDSDRQHPSGLHEYLRERKVTSVYLMGLGTEHQVKTTALDARALGFATCLIEDACRPLSLQPEELAAALKEMAQAGVSFVRSADLLRSSRDRAKPLLGFPEAHPQP